ncbi:MAG: hypothetical protein V4731_07425 [Pseudomonadota bacterium]
MSYRVRLIGFDDDASSGQARLAEARYCRALDESLGDAELVWPVYRAYRQLVALHGEAPDLEALDASERELFSQWQAAESAALAAALGSHRYMEDAEFEIRPA